MPVTIAQKKRIRELRASGCTYAEIQAQLGELIAKSSLSNICRSVELPPSHREKVRQLNREHLHAVRPVALAANRAKQQEKMQHLRAKSEQYLAGCISADKLALAMLYLGEGSKWPSYRGLQLGSSSPQIIKTYLCLLELCFDIKRSGLHARIQCRADQNIEEVEAYWTGITCMERRQLYRTYVDARSYGKPTKKRDYKGVCVIIGGSTEAQQELALIAEVFLEQMGL